jgi:hypothetical protein
MSSHRKAHCWAWWLDLMVLVGTDEQPQKSALLGRNKEEGMLTAVTQWHGHSAFVL